MKGGMRGRNNYVSELFRNLSMSKIVFIIVVVVVVVVGGSVFVLEEAKEGRSRMEK